MQWSSEQYLKFQGERTRPARDLLAAVPVHSVRAAVDLGCGPGNSTELIAARYPDARVLGVDNSEAMVEAAKTRLPRAEFELCRIEEWTDKGPWDLIYANASFQWIPEHETLLPTLAGRLSTGGSLAIQMPDNFGEPSHVALKKAAASVPFREKLKDAGKARTVLLGAEGYYKLLKPLCRSVDLWRTTYYHPLPEGIDGIIEWVRGTALLPYLTLLSGDEQAIFVAAYRDELAKGYATLEDGSVLLLFPRLFIIGTR